MKLYHKILLILIILILVVMPGDMNHIISKSLTAFTMQNWSVSYKMGFVFRGLMGTILLMFTKPITPELISVLMWIFILIYLIIICIYAKSIYKLKLSDTTFLLIIFILVQPTFLQRLLTPAMVGRLDIVWLFFF